MTQKLLILLFFLSSFFTNAQNLVWKTDMNDAIVMCMEQKKPLLIYFTGAGAPQKMQTEIFNTPDFAVWSRDNVILVKLDLSDPNVSNNVMEQNVSLKNAFGVDELPQVCFALANVRKGKTTFNKIGLMPYRPGGPKGWIKDSTLLLNPE
ncbi:thioredoxin family protein [Flavobacterium hungaricum]|uniref:Thioredoxin family protein n=1 Tax=Flavobacterium hungaricum TaxID=2082725 RepID=A0ABR9TJU3_9FLAO|nr:thioredoxin family protein [Flavobacterium hungaricum]MBE8725284.1 thioredoxin family protein [Flavobacterium hungaricum]